MARLTATEFADEAIYRKIQITRYADGQVEYAQNLINELNDCIAKLVLKKEIIETKKQHADRKKHVREMCMEYRNRLYSHFQKELKGFVKEQSKWLYANSPVKLEKKDNDKIVNNIFFEAFSDAENIRAFTQRIFNQIFQLWSAQLSIAYKTKQPLNEAVLLILGRKVNG